MKKTNNAMFDKKVFISYTTQDKGYAEFLAKLLRDNGFDIWFNGQAKSTEAWEVAIKNALEKSSLFIPIVSEEYMKSAFTLFELGGALGLEKKILPIVVSGDVSQMPFRFKKLQVVDAKKTDRDTLLHIIEEQSGAGLAA